MIFEDFKKLRLMYYKEPVHMGASFSRLGEIVRDSKQDVLSGDVFIFTNNQRDKIKLLHFDGDGPSIFYKKLMYGSFPLFQDGKKKKFYIDYPQFLALMNGMELVEGKRAA